MCVCARARAWGCAHACACACVGVHGGLKSTPGVFFHHFYILFPETTDRFDWWSAKLRILLSPHLHRWNYSYNAELGFPMVAGNSTQVFMVAQQELYQPTISSALFYIILIKNALFYFKKYT